MATGLELGVLGPLEVVRAEEPLRLGRGRESLLLACLIAEHGHAISADRLGEALWNGNRPRSAEHALHVYVSRLRKALGEDAIERRNGGYRLAAERHTIDADLFETLLERAREAAGAGDLALASTTYGEALALWRGPAFGELAFDEGVRAEADRLEDLRLSALEEHADVELALGRHNQLVATLETLTAEQPLREPLHGQLMLALYRSQRQADALAVYERLRQALDRDLGIAPGPEVRALHRAIVRQEGTLLVPGISPRGGRLPAATSTFVGRGPEIVALRDRMLEPEVRLITLVGPPGVGKTRLAVEAARTMTADYSDGVFLCELAPLTNPEAVDAAIAASVEANGDLVDWFRERRVLLVVDNFEHLLGGATRVARLLRACPGLDVLTTSRERLRLDGEHVVDVEPLSTVEAVALFSERADAVGAASWEFHAVETLCEALDRLPLAIELAASRSRSLSPAAALERLEQRLSLVAGTRTHTHDAGPRDTLEATIGWSYELLDARECRAFRSLSVFAGGCTLDAAEEVASADVDLLASLAEKSLLYCRVDQAGRDRFWMLETIREYAAARLEETGEAGELEVRHCSFYVDLAKRLEPAHFGAFDEIDLVEADGANFRSALGRAIARDDAGNSLRLVRLLADYWFGLGDPSASYQPTRRALELRGGDPIDRAHAQCRVACLAADKGSMSEAREYWMSAERLLSQAGDLRGLWRVYNDRSYFETLCDATRATGDAERAVELARLVGDSTLEMNSAFITGIALEAHELTGKRSDPSAVAHARSLCDVALAWFDLNGTVHMRAGILTSLSFHRLCCGDVMDALRLAQQGLRVEGGGTWQAWRDVLNVAFISSRCGWHETSAVLLGVGLREYLLRQDTPSTWDEPFIDEVRSAARDALGDDAFEQSCARGERMSVADAITLVLELDPETSTVT